MRRPSPHSVRANSDPDGFRDRVAADEASGRHSAVLEAIPDLVYVLNRDGIFLDCLAGAHAGQAPWPDEIIGRPIFEALPASAAGQAAGAIAAAFETGVVQTLVFSVPWPGGARSFEVRLRSAGFDHVVAVVREVTEGTREATEREVMLRILRIAASGVRHEQMIHEMLEEIRALFSLPNLFLALYDPGTDLIRFPYFVDESDPCPGPRRPGRTSTDWILRNRRALHVAPDEFRALVAAGEMELVGTPAETWLGVPLSGQGGAVGALVAQDYHTLNAFGAGTERLMTVAAHHISMALSHERSEARLAQLNDCFLRFGPDPESNIARLTAVCGDLLGATCSLYNRLEGGLLCSIGRWHVPEDFPVSDKPDGHLCHDVILKGSPEALVVRDLPRTDYARTDPNVMRHGLRTYVGRAVLFAGTPVGSLCAVYQGDMEFDASDHEVLNIIGAAIGVEEERRHAADELRHLNATLEHRVATRTGELAAAVDELQGFCYTVSHDLRAPLRHINGYAQILLEDHAEVLSDYGADCIANIRESSRHMGLLIDGLLGLSRITRTELCPTSVDVSAMAASIVRGLQTREPERQVRSHIAAGLSVWADAGLLRVALENLIGNAWKFSSQAKPAVIEVGTADTAKGRAVFVRDNGAGFEMDYVAKLFRPFERLHDARDFDGTGMGLAIVHRVVQRHGGEAWAEGAPGKGATFYFVIPAAPEVQNTSGQAYEVM